MNDPQTFWTAASAASGWMAVLIMAVQTFRANRAAPPPAVMAGPEFKRRRRARPLRATATPRTN